MMMTLTYLLSPTYLLKYRKDYMKNSPPHLSYYSNQLLPLVLLSDCYQAFGPRE